MAIKYLPFAGTYGTAIPFDQPCTAMGEHTVAGAITFTVNATDPQVTYGAILRLVADGVNVPNLSAFKVVGAGAYDNTASMVNQLIFFFDGVDYCVAINQLGTSGGGGGDITAPTLVSLRVENSNPSELLVKASDTLDSSSIPSLIRFILDEGSPGAGFTGSVTIVGDTAKIPLATPFVAGALHDLGYTGTELKDMAGNSLGTFSVQPITNNVVGGYQTESETYFTAQNVTVTADKDAADAVIAGAKAASLWTPTKALWFYLGDTRVLNAKDPADTDAAFRLTQGAGSAAVLDASGVTYDGVDDYLRTHLNPSLHLTLRGQTDIILVSSGSSAAGTKMWFGVRNTNQDHMYNDGSTVYHSIQGTSDVNDGSQTLAGIYIRTVRESGSITERRITRNNVQLGIVSATPTVDDTSVLVNGELFDGCWNNLDGPGASLFNAGTYGLRWIINRGCTNAEMTTIYNLVNAFKTAMSR